MGSISENLRVDPFDYVSRLEKAYLDAETGERERAALVRLARNYHENFLSIARDYAEFGAYGEALAVLGLCTEPWAMLDYYRAYISLLLGKKDRALELYKAAAEAPTDWVFPNKLEDIPVLKKAVECNPGDGNAWYLLGNLYYDKTVYESAIRAWERAAEKQPDFAVAWRNLSLAYYNKEKDPEKAKAAMKRAYALEPENPRIFLEHDQLLKKLDTEVEKRLENYERNASVFMQRDDLKVEYATLLSLNGRYREALDFIMENHFHPWEGGEGKITTQYVFALLGLVLEEMKAQNWEDAKALLLQARSYPENLGEGKLEGSKDNHVNYYLGLCEEALGNPEGARAYFEAATIGTDEPAGMMYYNDQPADVIYFKGLARQKLGEPVSGKSYFNKLIDYGERHMRDDVRIGYFAVSLPDFQIFDEDWNRRNRAHCHYLIGLGNLGYGNNALAAESFRSCIALEPTHWNAIRYLDIAENAFAK